MEIDPKLLIAQAVNFILFLFVFKKLLVKPFRSFIEGEKSKELEREKLLKDAATTEEQLQKKMEKFEKSIKEQTAKIIEEAKEQAAKVREHILEEARGEATEIKAKAKKETELAQEALKASVKDRIVDLSFYIVNESLKDVLNEETKKKITDRILKNLPQKLPTYEN